MHRHKKNIAEEEEEVCACTIKTGDRDVTHYYLVFSKSPPFARAQGLNLPWMK